MGICSVAVNEIEPLGDGRTILYIGSFNDRVIVEHRLRVDRLEDYDGKVVRVVFDDGTSCLLEDQHLKAIHLDARPERKK